MEKLLLETTNVQTVHITSKFPHISTLDGNSVRNLKKYFVSGFIRIVICCSLQKYL